MFLALLCYTDISTDKLKLSFLFSSKYGTTKYVTRKEKGLFLETVRLCQSAPEATQKKKKEFFLT